jgi:hypothetical protein
MLGGFLIGVFRVREVGVGRPAAGVIECCHPRRFAVPITALVPIIVVAVAYVAWIVRDILNSEVKHLPKAAWIAIAVLSVPLGGIIYLLVGKDES